MMRQVTFGPSIQGLFAAFAAEGKQLHLVGGAVRDLALGAVEQHLDDLDFTTDARPPETLAILKKHRYRTYEMGIEFGTVGAVLTGPRDAGFPKDVQITTYRSAETYRRGSRHPVVSFGDHIAQDLKRRDFSINSIAIDAAGAFVDPYDGLGDLDRRVLRIVGDPLETLAEDPLRILRIGRFIAKLGFTPDDALERAAWECATHLLDISRERWLQEMNKLLVAPHAADALTFLRRVRVLNLILPEVVALSDLHQRGPAPEDPWRRTLALVEAAGKDRAVSWAALMALTGLPWVRALHGEPYPDGAACAGLTPHPLPAASSAPTFDRHHLMAAELARGLARRFHMDAKTAEAVEFLVLHQRAALDFTPAWTDADVRRLYRDLQGHHAEVIALGACLRATGPAPGVASLDDLHLLRERIRDLDARDELVPRLPKGLGQLLVDRLALPRGPLLGDLMQHLTEAILAGELRSSLEPEDYLAFLERTDPPILQEARAAAAPSRKSGAPPTS